MIITLSDLGVTSENEVNWQDVSWNIGSDPNKVLTEVFIRQYKDHLDWHGLLMCQILSDELLEECIEYVDWDDLSRYQVLGEDFIRRHREDIDWSWIGQYYDNLHSGEVLKGLEGYFEVEGIPTDEPIFNLSQLEDHHEFEFGIIDWTRASVDCLLTEPFIEQYSEQLNWGCISRFQDLSDHFVERNRYRIDWFLFCTRDDLSLDLLERCSKFVRWDALEKFANVSADFLEKHKHDIERCKKEVKDRDKRVRDGVTTMS